MPCKDTSSKVTVWLDTDERLSGFDFSKITCSKTIGGATGYLEQCQGRSAEEILEIEFQELLDRLNPETSEDQF
ncbi:MAG: hypothetical protein IID18_05340, partial [Nitrospinae bacterium]|nr:hypothetical protein [Nitrospinota bacterium]